METVEIKRVMEAALLSADEPLAMADLRRLFENKLGADLLRPLLDELAQEFEERAVELVSVASGWRFQTRPAFAPYLDRLSPEKAPKYSRAVMETLAIIAYRQPVTRGDIEEIRGVSVSSNIIKTLEERGWIDAIGHKEVIGRPALFATTQHFLDDIGLRTLKELPPIDDLAKNDETLDMFGQNMVELSPPDAQAADATDVTSPDTDSAQAEQAEHGLPETGSDEPAEALAQSADVSESAADADQASSDGQGIGEPQDPAQAVAIDEPVQSS